MSVPITSQIYNPISGVFGTGRMQIFGGNGTTTATYTWTVPPGVGAVRARCFGGGGGHANGTGGGAFTMKAIYDLTGVTSVAITVGAGGSSSAGGTSSFGSYCSATGGPITASTVATASGGDINYNGGNSGSAIGAGVASLFGVGGSQNSPGPSGTGQSTNGWNTPGLLGQGMFTQGTAAMVVGNTSGMTSAFSIDLLGTGGGGYVGINGGGGTNQGGYPGGGGSGTGAPGMVIVEW